MLYLLFADSNKVFLLHTLDLAKEFLSRYPENFIYPQPVEVKLLNELGTSIVLKDNQKISSSTVLTLSQTIEVDNRFLEQKKLFWYSSTTFTKVREYLGYAIWLVLDDNSEQHHYFFSKQQAKAHSNGKTICEVPLTLEQNIVLYSYYEWKIIHNL